MLDVATTTMSSKGQIVIPDKIREKLQLQQGTEFVVISSGDALVLKPISVPSLDEFGELLESARTEALKAGLKRSDLEDAIKSIRKRS